MSPGCAAAGCCSVTCSEALEVLGASGVGVAAGAAGVGSELGFSLIGRAVSSVDFSLSSLATALVLAADLLCLVELRPENFSKVHKASFAELLRRT